jgi:hypothetical protein
MSLVQPPRIDNWHGEIFTFGAHRPRCANGAAEDGSENNVKLETLRFEAFPSLSRLNQSIGAQINVMPASENVRYVPLAFTVAHKDHLERHDLQEKKDE